MTPYFSIVIPLYNKEKHIAQTLKSVINQSYNNFEVVVVNDGSTDKSLEEAIKINDDRITVYSIENRGVSYARNYGIKHAKSNLIVLLDADDHWKSHHLEDLKLLYEKFPDCGLYAKAYTKRKNGINLKSIYKNIPQENNWKGVVNNYFKSSLANSIAWTSAVMIPKTTFEKVGYFNESLNSGEDTDLWIRIALKLPVAFYNKVSAIHLLNAQNKITKTKLSSRKHIDFSTYDEAAKNNIDLKNYINLNRVSMALQYKIEGAKNLEKDIKSHIDYNSISNLQKLLLTLPKWVIILILKCRNLIQRFIDLRIFR